ncbi:MAG TPA: HDOD domain-containing protein [Verrucomicrobiae bacterium]|jgi:HD-like signal output (HDOD) protein|nr:HDOD domain-containing protein [Verrucomicrobiae bacterium]
MQPTIYIVDDQPEVLETAILVVRGVMPEALVTGFTNPEKALAAIQSNPPRLILSDQIMPGMQGSELLEEVRLAAPGTLRIMMSGYVALDQLHVITSAHQYVAKPFDALELKELLRRTFAAQDRFGDKRLQFLVTSLRSLPSLPQVHHTLLSELQDNRGASATIGQMISQDAGLSAKVLQLANSPLFGREYVVSNPAEAVVCLGTRMIAAVVLAQSLFKHYKATRHQELDVSKVWNHSWETAALAQRYCREKALPRSDGDEAFLAGLLHETGRLILVDNFPTEYQSACEAARKENLSLTDALAKTFGTTPSQIAAFLLDLWGMPPGAVQAVSELDRAARQSATDFSMASALYIADQMATRNSPPDQFLAAEWDADYVRSIGCPPEVEAWDRTVFTSGR